MTLLGMGVKEEGDVLGRGIKGLISPKIYDCQSKQA